MVPSSYLEFMITAAGAAAAMLGLLFLAISLRSIVVFGPTASARARALAGSSFTGLFNAFSLALLAIVPKTNIGTAMVVLAAVCLYNTFKMHRGLAAAETFYRLIFVSSATYGLQAAGGVTLLIRPHESWIVNSLCFVIYASFAIALARAWLLIQTPEPTNARELL